MQKDKRKWTAEYIEGNVGKLTAQIVLNNLIDNNYKMCMSPYVKYFVNNASHTETFPEKGRRMILNSNKQ